MKREDESEHQREHRGEYSPAERQVIEDVHKAINCSCVTPKGLAKIELLVLDRYETLVHEREEEPKGLYGKYRVYKYPSGEEVTDCFVLRPEKDPAARKALGAYAASGVSEALPRPLRLAQEAREGEAAVMRAAKAELVGKIEELKREISEHKFHIADRNRELTETRDSLVKLAQERDEAIKERNAATADFAGAKAAEDKAIAAATDMKEEVKKIGVELKRERLLAKIVRRERDFYRSILKAIAWELEQPGKAGLTSGMLGSILGGKTP